MRPRASISHCAEAEANAAALIVLGGEVTRVLAKLDRLALKVHLVTGLIGSRYGWMFAAPDQAPLTLSPRQLMREALGLPDT